MTAGRKNVFTIPPDKPFLKTLAAELWRQADGDAFKLSNVRLFLPTRRACRHLGMVFAKRAEGRATLLPRLRALGDIDEDELIFADAESDDFPPALAPMRRLMLLTRHVQRRDPHLSWDQAVLSAEALARFLDQTQIAACDLKRLPELVEERELAEHWQQTIAFLDIVTTHWPAILKEEGCLDPADRRNKVLAAQAELWRRRPPAYPVIAAGSTGAVPATAELLKTIAAMPKGMVILPGLDLDIDPEAWEEIDETHPQHSMKALLQRMGIDRGAVRLFPSEKQGGGAARAVWLSEAFRPAQAPNLWRELKGRLDPSATHGVTRLVLDHPQEEAQVIALRLREILETPNKTAALVTPDRALAARVAALLSRWGVRVDDSGGASVLSSPLGAFLHLVLNAADPAAGNVDALALLKHPRAACGLEPKQCRDRAREAELRIRKGQKEDLAFLKEPLAPLIARWREKRPLAERIATHIAVAESLATTTKENGAAILWKGEQGQDIVAWLEDWQSSAADFPPLTGGDYGLLYKALAGSKLLRSGRATHPGLSILGPLEARLIDADLVVLGGLNEGSWPPDVGFDPWLSRPMRKKLGLPSPEFRIGLSAHDFVQLVSGKEVMLTRALKAGGAPTVPSRFLMQLDAVLQAAGLSQGKRDALADARPWKEWALALDAPESEPKPCAKPSPRPPLADRPKSLSVTKIATWLSNPYAIYAEYILRLKKLDELDPEVDAADRGSMIHTAIEKFSSVWRQDLPPDAAERLIALAHGIFAEEDNPRIRAFWETRFAESAAWFIEKERDARRAGEAPHENGIEAEGSYSLDGFTLKGRADRINTQADGSLKIIDYKTGRVPTGKDVHKGFQPQLPLLALIASVGGFKNMSKASVASCEYWVLKSGKNCNKVCFDANLPELVARAESGLKQLIATFADPATPYEAVPKPWLEPARDDYAHLSRIAEWGRVKEKN